MLSAGQGDDSPTVRWATRWAADEDGSTLLMYPFAILIVFLVGAIAIDAAVLFQAHREAVDVSAGLASDIAGVVDEGVFATTGEVRIDGARAGEVLSFANGASLADHPNGLGCTAAILGAEVEVTCTGTGQALLLPLGGGVGDLTFSATSRATAFEQG